MCTKLLRNIRKKYVVMLGAAIVMILLSGILLARPFADRADDRLKAHDVALTNQEMTAARKTLVPLIKPLALQLPSQNAAWCIPGDPTLYAHLCGTQAETIYAGGSGAPQDAETTARNLQALDTTLKANGWQYYTNDFRKHASYPASSWAGMLRNQGMTISYVKGTCIFEVVFVSPAAKDQQHAPRTGSLDCYISSGPPSF